jgi:hypothetical protein
MIRRILRAFGYVPTQDLVDAMIIAGLAQVRANKLDGTVQHLEGRCAIQQAEIRNLRGAADLSAVEHAAREVAGG